MRRPALIAIALLGALVVAGCGAQGVSAPVPKECVPAGNCGASGPTFPIVPAFHLKGDATKGASIFASAGCTGCHTLAAAHSSGTVGPDLDQLKPDYRAVTAQVTNGGTGMPAFGKTGQLSTQQIADVAQYVVSSTNASP